MTPIASRIARYESRIRDSISPLQIARLVERMTSELDPEAIPALLRLLEHEWDAKDSIGHALLRYGESAVDALRAHVAAHRTRTGAELLECLLLRNRLRQLGCF